MLPSASRVLPVVALGVSLAAPAFAQMRPVLRAERTVFATAHVGFAAYVGDHDRFPWDLGYWQGATAEELPVLYGATLGYQFRPGLAASVGGAIGNYTTIWRDANGGPLNNYNRRYMADALVRMTAGAIHARFAPYAELGVRVANGETNPPGNGTVRVSAGPLVGVGVDMALSPHTSFLLGGNVGLMLPDAATDANDFTGVSRFGPFDLLGGFSAGLKYTVRGAITRPYVLAINGPEMLEAGQSGTFTAVTNSDIATGSVGYVWSFGDGTTAEGLEVSHVYNRPGTYDVLFTATSPHGIADASTRVEVVAAPVPPSVLAVQATPSAVGVRDAVRFSARVEGDAPLTYAWAFGDGATSTSASPSHAYARAGAYTATLEVRNARGRATGSTSVTVAAPTPPPPAAPACAIAELTSIFFARGSAVLDARAEADLRANVAALAAPECATTDVRVEGYAAPGESPSLAEARAQAVAAAYATMGLTRVTAMGMGLIGDPVSRKEDTSQFRRVDSIPQRAGVRVGMEPGTGAERSTTPTTAAMPSAPAARAARPANVQTSVPGPGYVVVVGGAPSMAEAASMAAAMDGDVRVLAGQTADGEAVYRVAVGHHTTLGAARSALARIRAAGPADAWLLRVR